MGQRKAADISVNEASTEVIDLTNQGTSVFGLN